LSSSMVFPSDDDGDEEEEEVVEGGDVVLRQVLNPVDVIVEVVLEVVLEEKGRRTLCVVVGGKRV